MYLITQDPPRIIFKEKKISYTGKYLQRKDLRCQLILVELQETSSCRKIYWKVNYVMSLELLISLLCFKIRILYVNLTT
jgi:hypothetical protein